MTHKRGSGGGEVSVHIEPSTAKRSIAIAVRVLFGMTGSRSAAQMAIRTGESSSKLGSWAGARREPALSSLAQLADRHGVDLYLVFVPRVPDGADQGESQ